MSKNKSVVLPGSYQWKKYAPEEIRDLSLKDVRKKLSKVSEQYGMAGEQLPGDGLGEGQPKKTRTLHTIKRVLKGKYKNGRSLIN